VKLGMKTFTKRNNWAKTSFSSNFGDKLLSCLSFSISASTVTYIFTVPTCTTTIITLEPCVANTEIQHF